MAIVNKSMDKDGSPVEVGYSFNNSECDSTVVGARSLAQEWLTVTVNTSSKKFIITGQPNESGERYGEIVPTINGSDCSNRIGVTQEAAGEEPRITCVRGTDNGNDVIDDKTYPHYLFVCSDNDIVADSIVVHSLMYKNITTDEWTDLPTTEETAAYLSSNPSEQWIKAYRTTTGGRCGEGAIYYLYESNNTGAIREMTFELRTTSEITSVDVSTGKPYEVQGHTNPCTAWTVTVKQCRPGYFWCVTDGETSGVEVACGGECTSQHPFHFCMETCGGGGDFNINGHTSNFAERIDACENGTYSITLSDSASFSISPSNTGVKINNAVQGDLDAGTYTISFTKIDENTESANTITFTHGSSTIVMTLNRTCNVIYDCSDCKSIFPDDDKLDYVGISDNLKIYKLRQTIPAAGGDDNEIIIKVLSVPCAAAVARCSDCDWIKDKVHDDFEIWEQCDGAFQCIRLNLKENTNVDSRDGYIFVEWYNDDVSNPQYTICYRIDIVQEGKESQTCNCSSLDSGIPTSSTFGPSSTSATYNIYTSHISGCKDTINYNISSGSEWISAFWVTNMSAQKTGQLGVSISALPSGTSSRTGVIQITIPSQDNPCHTITIKQNNGGSTCSCEEISIDDVTFEHDETEEVTVNITAPTGCITKALPGDDPDHFWVTNPPNTTDIVVTPRGENPGSEAYVETVTVNFTLSDSSTCTKTFVATQNGTGTTHDCNCGSVTGVLNISAEPVGGTPIGTFTGDTDCSISDFKAVKYDNEDIVNISNISFGKTNNTFKIYANITNQNTSENGRTQRLLVQKVNGGQMCGQLLIEQQGTTPKCVVELIITKDASKDCGINFKVKEKCSDIGTYDVIEWGYTTANTPSFDGQAFGAEAATGATGITQDANIPETVPTNYHIWWRNRTVQSVSGMSTIQLSKCEHTPTKFSATVRIDQVEDSSMSPNSIDWGDGYITTPLQKGAEYIHMYNDDTQDYTCTVFGNRIYTMNKNNHHVTVCDCVALPEINPYVFFGNTSSSKSINVNPNGCSNMYWVKEGSQTWCTPQFEEDDTKLKLTASSNSSGNIRSAVFLVGIRAGSSSQDPRICQWIYAKQGDTATCNTVYTEMNGKTVYFEFNNPNTQTILTNCKYANMKDIETGSTSDIVYEEYDGDKWSWEEYERYGKNWITGCTWLTTGGLQINVTGNYSNTTRSATLNIRLLDDADNTICARIYVSQYCEHCTGAESRGDITEDDNG